MLPQHIQTGSHRNQTSPRPRIVLHLWVLTFTIPGTDPTCFFLFIHLKLGGRRCVLSQRLAMARVASLHAAPVKSQVLPNTLKCPQKARFTTRGKYVDLHHLNDSD